MPSAFAKDPPTSAEQLRDRVELALKAKDTNAFMALFNWQGVSADMKSEMHIKENISGKGNLSKAFWGDYVQSCTVQKTSDSEATIQLIISENGKNVFESKEVESKDPIVYQRK